MKHQPKIFVKEHVLTFATGLAVFYWIFEAFLDAFIFFHSTFASALFFPNLNEGWMRGLICFLFIALGLYANRAIKRQKRAQKALAESETKYKIVADNTYDWEFWIGPDGTFIYSSPSCKRITGHDNQEFIDNPDMFYQIIHPDDRDQYSVHKKMAQDKIPCGDIEFRIIRTDGVIRWIGHACQPVFSANGKFLGTRASNRDITERRQAEDALRESRDKLEQRVKQATADLSKTVDILQTEAVARKNAEELLQKAYGELELRVEERTAELRERQRTISTLMSNLPGMAYRCRNDQDWTMEFISEGSLELTGYAPSDFINNRTLSYSQIIHSDDREKVWGGVQAALNTKQPFRLTYRITTANGRQRWIWEQGRGIFSVAGELLALEGLMIDVTDRREAEEEIRRRETQFRTLVEASPNALLLVAADGTIAMVNRQAEVIFCYQRNELIGQSVEMLVPRRVGEHRRMCAEYSAKPEQRLMGVGRDLFAVRKDGTEVPVEIGLSPIETPEGSFTLATLTDITLRKQAEEELHKVNRSLRAISQCNEIMVRATQEQDFLNGVCTSIVAYGGYRLVWVGFAEENENGVEIVRPAAHAGYEAEYLKAVEIRWDDSKLGRGPAGTAIRTGTPCICGNISTDPVYEPWREEALKRGYLSTMALPLIDSGTTLGAMSIYSPQPNAFGKEEVELLMELANDMAYGINSIRARKEREKAEAASLRLNKELVRKNKELESIIFVASHDLRSALVNVQGFSRELGMTSETVRTVLSRKDIPKALKEQLQKSLEEDIPEAVDFITNSTAKIDTLLNGLLRLSRVGREEMKVVWLDMNAIMAEITRSMQFKTAQTNARIEIGPLPPCMGDYSLISHAFSNLIDNSIKFLDKTRQGIIRVSGKTENGRSVYCVEDNGVGIAPEYQSKVFEVFQRLTPDETPGEGLGLTIVRQIAERHNGRVWMESEPGKGSKFFVLLPSE